MKILTETLGVSLVVDAKNHHCAEQGLVAVSEIGEIVSCWVPETLAGNAQALPGYLSDHALNHNFVWGDVQALHMSPHVVYNLLCLTFRFHVIVLLAIKLPLADILNNPSNLTWVKTTNGLTQAQKFKTLPWYLPLSFARLKSEGVLVCGTCTKIVHF